MSAVEDGGVTFFGTSIPRNMRLPIHYDSAPGQDSGDPTVLSISSLLTLTAFRTRGLCPDLPDLPARKAHA
jgi:hypothetical protein